MTDRAVPDPGPRTPADLNPPVPGGGVVGNMLRISGNWALAAAACGVLAMGWSELADNGQVWLLWTCVVVAGQLAAIAYSATGISAQRTSASDGASAWNAAGRGKAGPAGRSRRLIGWSFRMCAAHG